MRPQSKTKKMQQHRRNNSMVFDFKRLHRKIPISYCSPKDHLEIVSKQAPKAIIGQFRNKFDVKKMNPLNTFMWKKGMIF